MLPVGGIKEKVLAARRHGIVEVILPRQNEKNINEDLSPELRKELKVHYVDNVEEVLAIAQHEHIPEMAAVEMGNYLAHTPGGEMRIKAIIRDDIAEAAAAGDRPRELALKLVLRNFVLQHPACEERHRAQLPPVERRNT